MSALTSLLARDAVVPLSTIEDALQRQVLEGGELDTALLELDALDENVVGSYRAAAYGLAPASRAELMWVDRDTLKRLSPEQAAEFRVVPLSTRDGLLTLAAKQPLEPSQLVQLQRDLETAVDVRIATEVRLEAALAAHYGAGIAGRLRLLAERLEAREPGELRLVTPLASDPGAAPGLQLDLDGDDEPEPAPRAEVEAGQQAVEEVEEASPGAEAPGGFRDDPTARMAVPPVHEPEPPAAAAPVVRQVAVVPVVALGTAPPRPRVEEPKERPAAHSSTPPRGVLSAAPGGARTSMPAVLGAVAQRREPFPGVPKGPLTPERARELFELAETRDHVVELFFAFARQYFDASALFSVREGRVTGIEGVGLRGVDRVEQVSVELPSHGALEESLRGLLPRVVDLGRRREDRPLAKALGRVADQPAALMPVPIRQRAVLFLYGDRHGERFAIDELAPLVAMLPVVGRTFERIIHERKVYAREVKESFRPGPPEAMPAGVSVAPPAPVPSVAPELSAHSTHSGVHPPKLPTMPGLAQASRAPSEPPPGTKVAAEAARPEAPPPAAPEPTERAADDLSRVDAPFRPSMLTSPMARQAMSSLGLRGEAPPPPRVSKREAALPDDLETRATVQLEAVKTGTLPRLTPAAGGGRPPSQGSSLPPGAGAYRQSGAPEPQAETAAKGEANGGAGSNAGAGAYRLSEPPGALRRRRRSDTTRPDRLSTRPLAPGMERDQRGARPAAASPAGDPTVSRDPPEPRTLSEAPPGTGSYSVRDVGAEVPRADALRAPRVPAEAREDKPRPQTPAEARPEPRQRPATPAERPLTPSRRPDPRRDEQAAEPVAEVVSRSPAVRSSLPPAPRRPSPSGSIVIDLSPDAHALIDELCATGPEDEQPQIGPLLRLGQAGLEAIEARFPGPLWFSRAQLHMRFPAGRDISALARALIACDDAGVAVLERLVRSEDVEVRLCATLLAADWVHAALLPAFVERLFDPDGQIRRIASAALPVYRNVQGFRATVETLRRRAGDTGEPIPTRLSAMEALSVLRDPGSVELLIELQLSRERQISVPAHRALVAITAQDFGNTRRKWVAWYDKNRDRHRVEWLIDGLMHGEERVRAVAGGELQKLTQVYYGYAASAPKRARERSQERYRSWWSSEGHRLFV